MFENGIYIGANFVDTETLKVIDDLKKEIKTRVSDRVGLLEPHFDPHITIMYSFDEPEGYIEDDKFPKDIDLSFSSVDVFSYNYKDVNGSCIVLKVKSKTAENLHNLIKEKNKVSPSYCKYEPHITLFLVNDMLPDDVKKKINNLINIPNIKINAKCEYDIEDICED